MSRANAINFYRLVSKMRTAQKEYFRTRNAGVLMRSRQLEREVDAWIAQGDKYFAAKRKEEPALQFEETTN